MHVALERISNSSVECPRETPYSSEACPRGHLALGYSVRGNSFKGGHVTPWQRYAVLVIRRWKHIDISDNNSKRILSQQPTSTSKFKLSYPRSKHRHQWSIHEHQWSRCRYHVWKNIDAIVQTWILSHSIIPLCMHERSGGCGLGVVNDIRTSCLSERFKISPWPKGFR